MHSITRANNEVELVSLDSHLDFASDLGQQLVRLCESAQQNDSDAAHNISPLDWPQRPETLLYCLYRERRFDAPNGQLFAALHEQKMVAVSGIYRSEFNPSQIAIAGVRTYTDNQYRNRFWHGEYLIPEQLTWARRNNIAMVLFSFNDESAQLMAFLRRAMQQKAGVLGKAFPSVYKNLTEHPKPIYLKNTKQRIFKLVLKAGFSWDFSNLEVSE